ncbi:hypothetical protein [Ralstonia chuxiongensis]|nr:hypothetical protein [Ralstonia chuxiongensis]
MLVRLKQHGGTLQLRREIAGAVAQRLHEPIERHEVIDLIQLFRKLLI